MSEKKEIFEQSLKSHLNCIFGFIARYFVLVIVVAAAAAAAFVVVVHNLMMQLDNYKEVFFNF